MQESSDPLHQAVYFGERENLRRISTPLIDLLARYLRRIDTFSSAHISCFLTPTSHRFLLLHLPHPPNTSPPPPPSQSSNPNAFPPFLPYSSSPANPSLGGTTPFTGTSLTSSRFSSLANSTASATGSGSSASGGGGGGGIPNNPTSPATEEAIRLFFWEVFESWIKGQLSPFDGGEGDLKANMGRSEVFRGKVVGAGRKYL